MYDEIALENVLKMEGGLVKVENPAQLKELMEQSTCLTDRETQVLCLRYGLVDGHPCTLEEVGKKFQVTRERIRQIEAKALMRLRNECLRKSIQKKG